MTAADPAATQRLGGGGDGGGEAAGRRTGTGAAAGVDFFLGLRASRRCLSFAMSLNLPFFSRSSLAEAGYQSITGSWSCAGRTLTLGRRMPRRNRILRVTGTYSGGSRADGRPR